jgi:hypothetical protein
MSKFILIILSGMLLLSCAPERYRKDKANRLSDKADLASDFHAKQAVNFTQRNIDRKDKTEKQTNKRKEKIQDQLNELNAPKKVAKTTRKHTGRFNLY